ncbi:MAG TPA: hypothetical protein VKB34_13990 [Povalibacter sp.]|nr:hypothetical protein [Povalibacter sp.]
MIWHIFRKDCRVLYMAIAGAALAHAIAAGTWIAVGPFEPRSTLSTAANMLSALGLTLAVVVSVMAVHEDLLSGATSDWAVRPIRRRHMLWAKIVFALTAIHGPVLLIDFVQAVTFGFPVAAAAGAALTRGGVIFCTLTLPAIVFAAFSRTLVSWAALTFAWLIGTILVSTLASRLTGVYGMWDSMLPTVHVALLLVACAVALGLLYSRRAWSAAAVMLASQALTVPLAAIPWQTWLGIHGLVSQPGEIARALQVSFDPGRFRLGVDVQRPDIGTTVILPLQIAGLPADHLLLIENTTLRLVDSGSVILRTDNPSCYGSGPTCWDHSPVSADIIGDATIDYPIQLPTAVYARIRDKPIQVELQLSLTVLGRTSHNVISNQKDYERLDLGRGQCLVARSAWGGRDVDLRCLRTTPPPACRRVFIDDAGTPSVIVQCQPDYRTAWLRVFPDMLERDPPISGDSFPRSMERSSTPGTLTLETFAPDARFARNIIIPGIHLGEQTQDPQFDEADRRDAESIQQTPWSQAGSSGRRDALARPVTSL